MENLNKTIKKLTETDYRELVSAIAGRKNNKPYVVLENARHKNMDEKQMMEILEVNRTAYYTLKCRLNEKVAEFLSSKSLNPINELKEKVALVPSVLFGNDREVSIRSLKALEKQLIEYDLSNELIVVYKALARLSLFNGDYDFYEKQYNKHVAYSLSVVKAEDLFFDFTKYMGIFLLTRDEIDLEPVKKCIRELTNISQLYYGHRLFVLNHIVRLYNLCFTCTRQENLKAMEMEVENILNQINHHFANYKLDTFYQSIRFIVDFLYFEYYHRCGNSVRSEHHYQQVVRMVPDVALRPMFSFYVIQFLNSRIEQLTESGDLNSLNDISPELIAMLTTNVNNPYPFISSCRIEAIIKFYNRDFSGAAKTIHKLRNDISLKRFLQTDIECKLFQALNYAMVGEDGLCSQIMQSVKRQLSESEANYESATIFLRMLKSAIKPEEFRRKVKHVSEFYEKFNSANIGSKRILSFLKMDESLLRRLCNPIKE